eukprot:2073274-Rhodomonas_salina.2
MSRTDLAYGSTRSAMSGTDLAYGPTRLLGDVRVSCYEQEAAKRELAVSEQEMLRIRSTPKSFTRIPQILYCATLLPGPRPHFMQPIPRS